MATMTGVAARTALSGGHGGCPHRGIAAGLDAAVLVVTVLTLMVVAPVAPVASVAPAQVTMVVESGRAPAITTRPVAGLPQQTLVRPDTETRVGATVVPSSSLYTEWAGEQEPPVAAPPPPATAPSTPAELTALLIGALIVLTVGVNTSLQTSTSAARWVLHHPTRRPTRHRPGPHGPGHEAVSRTVTLPVASTVSATPTAGGPLTWTSIIEACLRAHRDRRDVLSPVFATCGPAASVEPTSTIGSAASTLCVVVPGRHSVRTVPATIPDHAALTHAALSLTAVGATAGATPLTDYRHQVRREDHDFWQTVLCPEPQREGPTTSRALLITDRLTSSVLFVLLGPLVLLGGTAQLWRTPVGTTGVAGAATKLVAVLPPHILVLGVAVPDLILTLTVAALQRRPGYLLMGVTFLPLRCLDAWLCLSALRSAATARTSGTTGNPTRQPPAGARTRPVAGQLVAWPAPRSMPASPPRTGAASSDGPVLPARTTSTTGRAW